MLKTTPNHYNALTQWSFNMLRKKFNNYFVNKQQKLLFQWYQHFTRYRFLVFYATLLHNIIFKVLNKNFFFKENIQDWYCQLNCGMYVQLQEPHKICYFFYKFKYRNRFFFFYLFLVHTHAKPIKVCYYSFFKTKQQQRR